MAKSKPISISYIAVFLAATISLSQFFGAHKYFAESEDLKGALIAISSLLVFAVAMVYMTYSIYKEERFNSNLKVRFAPYDWIYSLEQKFRSSNG